MAWNASNALSSALELRGPGSLIPLHAPQVLLAELCDEHGVPPAPVQRAVRLAVMDRRWPRRVLHRAEREEDITKRPRPSRNEEQV